MTHILSPSPKNYKNPEEKKKDRPQNFNFFSWETFTITLILL